MDHLSNTRVRLPIVRLQVVRERSLTYEAGITGPQDLTAAFRALLEDQDREVFAVAMLDSKHRIRGLQVASVGTLSATLTHPREVFKLAVTANVSAIAVAHNHPSGSPEPSPEDRALTRQLLAAGEILGIRVLDHLVIGDGVHVSLRETSGLWSEYPFHV